MSSHACLSFAILFSSLLPGPQANARRPAWHWTPAASVGAHNCAAVDGRRPRGLGRGGTSRRGRAAGRHGAVTHAKPDPASLCPRLAPSAGGPFAAADALGAQAEDCHGHDAKAREEGRSIGCSSRPRFVELLHAPYCDGAEGRRGLLNKGWAVKQEKDGVGSPHRPSRSPSSSSSFPHPLPLPLRPIFLSLLFFSKTTRRDVYWTASGRGMKKGGRWNTNSEYGRATASTWPGAARVRLDQKGARGVLCLWRQ